jgi:hypothetical protein
MAAEISRRKQIFSAAASSLVSGGVSRVFTCPARGAFVMITRAQIFAEANAEREADFFTLYMINFIENRASS